MNSRALLPALVIAALVATPALAQPPGRKAAAAPAGGAQERMADRAARIATSEFSRSMKVPVAAIEVVGVEDRGTIQRVSVRIPGKGPYYADISSKAGKVVFAGPQ